MADWTQHEAYNETSELSGTQGNKHQYAWRAVEAKREEWSKGTIDRGLQQVAIQEGEDVDMKEEGNEQQEELKGCQFRTLGDFYKLPIREVPGSMWERKRRTQTKLALMELLLYIATRPVREVYIKWATSVTEYDP
jgi:hypothetical protein